MPCQVGPLPDDTSLLALTDYVYSNESASQTNPWFGDSVESEDEDSSLGNDVVPRVCFGVVSCSRSVYMHYD